MSHIHLPDGVLPWWMWVGGYLIAILLVAILWGKRSGRTDTKRFALLGVFAALMILIMSIEIPGFPYHANLSIVTGIVLGPSLAVLAAFIVNLFLAFLGHGGITVVGLNTLVVAVEIIAGYGVFRALLRIRTPLALAAFLAVVIGLGCGTVASYGVIAVSAPAITQSLTSEHTGLHEETGHEHEHDVLERATTDDRINLKRLAALMFGFGSIGWVLEGILSAAILVSLNRVYPELITRKE